MRPFSAHLAVLQVWSEQDYSDLKAKLGGCYPFSHYFRRYKEPGQPRLRPPGLSVGWWQGCAPSSVFAVWRDWCGCCRSPLPPHAWGLGCSREGTGIQAPREPPWLRAGRRQRWEGPRVLTVLLPSCSGVIGSGLCVFSRFPILDTFLYQYSLNGYPYMVSGARGIQHCDVRPHRALPALASPLPLPQLQHGDWFGGKSVGLVVTKISGIVFNIYITHVSIPGKDLAQGGRWGGGGHEWPNTFVGTPCFHHCSAPFLLGLWTGLMTYCSGRGLGRAGTYNLDMWWGEHPKLPPGRVR